MQKINVAIVDDHLLINKALQNMISEEHEFEVLMTAKNGEDFIRALEKSQTHPDVTLMDINMPFKNGIETTKHLSEHYPDLKIIALTMDDDEATIIKMIKAGAKGYLLKDMQPRNLFQAIKTVQEKGVFYTDFVTQSLLNVKTEETRTRQIIEDLKERELYFIKLSCSEMTYKQIADIMCLSPKTIDGYRDSVFVKLDVKSRVGMVLFAVANELN